MKDDLKKNQAFPHLHAQTPTENNSNRKKPRGAYINGDILRSKVWFELTMHSGIAQHVYLLFLSKRVLTKDRRKKGEYNIINNGELQFTYKEAEKMGITAPRFTRAIDILIDYGFIEITEQGSSAHRMCTKYGISEKWRDYGKPGFSVDKRPPCKFCGAKEPFKNRRKDGPRVDNETAELKVGKILQASTEHIDSTRPEQKPVTTKQVTKPSTIKQRKRKPVSLSSEGKAKVVCGDCERFETQGCKLHGLFNVPANGQACSEFLRDRSH